MENLAVPLPVTSPNPEVSPVPLQQIAVQTKAVKPTPKPRKQKPQTPPPHRRPIQESSEHMTKLLRSPVATTDECNYDQQRKSHGMPPPVLPKRHSPRTTARHSGIAQLRRPRSADFVPISEREEEEDGTGDSGRGTGSGAAKYGDIQEWREAMENPPETPDHRYQTLRRETMDEVLSYEEVDYNR